MPTRRSTGTPAGAGSTRRAPGLDRARRQLREIEETVPGPPSSLDIGPQCLGRALRAPARCRSHREHNETSPALTGGDVDADWEDAYSVGDEAPGGDNPTPDQDRVDDIGKALGVEYQDNEELKASDKIAERDRHRWELDPASSDDYKRSTRLTLDAIADFQLRTAELPKLTASVLNRAASASWQVRRSSSRRSPAHSLPDAVQILVPPQVHLAVDQRR